jgi:hypothetical protein
MCFLKTIVVMQYKYLYYYTVHIFIRSKPSEIARLFIYPRIYAIINLFIYSFEGPEWSSRYSESLRAGWYGFRTPVVPRFSVPVHTGSKPDPTTCKIRIAYPSRGKVTRTWGEPNISLLASRL